MYLLLRNPFPASLGLASALSLPARVDPRKRAVYSFSNDPNGANLPALSISLDDGTLSGPILAPTDEKDIDATRPSRPGSLFSQNSPAVSHDVRPSAPPHVYAYTQGQSWATSLPPSQYLFTVVV